MILPPLISRSAIASTVVGGYSIGFRVLLWTTATTRQFMSRPVALCIIGLPALAGFVAGIVAIVSVDRHRPFVAGKGWASVGLCLSLAAGVSLISSWELLPEVARQAECEANLRRLAGALVRYRSDYGKRLPKSLDILVPAYVPSNRGLACPCSWRGDTIQGYYFYAGALAAPRSDGILACDARACHLGGRNCLTAGLRVRWVREEHVDAKLCRPRVGTTGLKCESAAAATGRGLEIAATEKEVLRRNHRGTKGAPSAGRVRGAPATPSGRTYASPGAE
jgi:hypothetical protein